MTCWCEVHPKSLLTWVVVCIWFSGGWPIPVHVTNTRNGAPKYSVSSLTTQGRYPKEPPGKLKDWISRKRAKSAVRAGDHGVNPERLHPGRLNRIQNEIWWSPSEEHHEQGRNRQRGI